MEQLAWVFQYGITYVDLKTKCVFNGSDVGKEYSAKGILERLGYIESPSQSRSLKPLVSGHLDSFNEETKIGGKNDLIDILVRPEYLPENPIQYPFKKDVKKKKKGLSI